MQQRERRPSRLSRATTCECCVVCRQLADQERYVLRTPRVFRFFRACSCLHAAQYQRSCGAGKGAA